MSKERVVAGVVAEIEESNVKAILASRVGPQHCPTYTTLSSSRLLRGKVDSRTVILIRVDSIHNHKKEKDTHVRYIRRNPPRQAKSRHHLVLDHPTPLTVSTIHCAT